MSRFFFPPEIKSRNVLQFLNSFYKVKNLTCPNSLPKIRIKKWDIFVSQVKGGGFAASFGTNRGKICATKAESASRYFCCIALLTLKHCVADGKSAKALLQECKRVFERGKTLRTKFGLEGANSREVKEVRKFNCLFCVSTIFCEKRKFRLFCSRVKF